MSEVWETGKVQVDSVVAPPDVEHGEPDGDRPKEFTVNIALHDLAEKLRGQDDQAAGVPTDEEDLSLSQEILSKVKFGKDVEILAISSPSSRILCYFLGTNAVEKIEHASIEHPRMVAFLLMENMIRFMGSKGYEFAGELNFNDRGICMCDKHTWDLLEENVSFTSVGYLFFEHSGDKDKNVVFDVYTDPNAPYAKIYCRTKDETHSKTLLKELEVYTKGSNCLRGQKLKDIHVTEATFSLENSHDGCTWDKFYYPDAIRDIFESDIFGFLDNVESYVANGIKKRGIMLTGCPGVGKTTLGRMICKYANKHTVIWITPELIGIHGGDAIRLLYILAEYLSPVAIILEDIDLYSEDRNDVSESVRLGTLLNVLDGVNSVSKSVTVAMTNRIELIEKALRNRPGRFDRVVEIPAFDDKDLRIKMLTDRLEPFNIKEEAFELVVSETNGFTGAAMQEFVNSLRIHFINNQLPDDTCVDVDMTKKIFARINQFSLSGKNGQSTSEGAGFAAEKK